MTSRDDIVIRPQLDDQRAAQAANVRSAGRLGMSRRKSGALARWAKMRGARSAAMAHKVKTRQAGGVARARGGARFFSKVAVGGAAAAIAMAGIATLRLGTGRSFENMGKEIKQLIYGGLGERARANMRVSEQFMADPEIARSVGMGGGMSKKLRKLHQSMVDMEEEQLLGEAEIRRLTSVENNGTIDLLILTIKKKFLAALKGGG